MKGFGPFIRFMDELIGTEMPAQKSVISNALQWAGKTFHNEESLTFPYFPRPNIWKWSQHKHRDENPYGLVEYACLSGPRSQGTEKECLQKFRIIFRAIDDSLRPQCWSIGIPEDQNYTTCYIKIKYVVLQLVAKFTIKTKGIIYSRLVVALWRRCDTCESQDWMRFRSRGFTCTMDHHLLWKISSSRFFLSRNFC